MKGAFLSLALSAFFGLLICGCGDGAEQAQEGSADIIKSNPPQTGTPPDFQARETEKMREGRRGPQ